MRPAAMLDAPSDYKLADAEIAVLRRTARPGDKCAVYRHPRRGGAFRFVGPASPSLLAPRESRGRKLIGFVDMATGYVRPVRAGDPVEGREVAA
jgi:hypothetical protein